MRIPFLELSRSIADVRPLLDAAHARVLDRGQLLLGPELEAFEADWARWLGAGHAVGVANGLDALRLALTACGVRTGDEVIVPSNTYVATWLAVSQIGAHPVPVEPVEADCTIDPMRIAEAITARTRAIMPVHLYGQACDMQPILELARKHGLAVIEDAAQAHGASYRGKRIGAHGHAVCWSFYPTKNLGALADAGAITTDDAGLADRLRVARNYGQRQRYVCEVQGWNSRLDELNAAFLTAKLPRLEAWNRQRRILAERYMSELGDGDIQLPRPRSAGEHAWHLFVIRHPRRDALRQALADAGIGTACHYPVPPHLQPAYDSMGLKRGMLPIAERIHDSCLSLPLHPHLSADEQETVIEAVRSFR